MVLNEVLQALDELATRYEQAARSIRNTRSEIARTELARSVAPETEGYPVKVSEAIRMVLGQSPSTPMLAAEIKRGIDARRIPVMTKSKDLRGLVDSTLYSMQRAGQVRRTEKGWVLA